MALPAPRSVGHDAKTPRVRGPRLPRRAARCRGRGGLRGRGPGHVGAGRGGARRGGPGRGGPRRAPARGQLVLEEIRHVQRPVHEVAVQPLRTRGALQFRRVERVQEPVLEVRQQPLEPRRALRLAPLQPVRHVVQLVRHQPLEGRPLVRVAHARHRDRAALHPVAAQAVHHPDVRVEAVQPVVDALPALPQQPVQLRQ